MPSDEQSGGPGASDSQTPQQKAFYDRLDDLVALTRQRLRRVRRVKAAGLLTDDVVRSALASAIEAGPAEAASVSSAEETDLVWIALRRALGRKIYKYFQAPSTDKEMSESRMAPEGGVNWLVGLATKEITEHDVAGCYAMGNELLGGLDPDERYVAELLLLGYSAREIGESNERQLSYSQVRRLIESIRARFREQGFDRDSE